MRSIIFVALLALSASAEIVPILTPDEVSQLEAHLAANPDDHNAQKLLGENYALAILGVTALSEYNLVTAVDPEKSASDFAIHARDALRATQLGMVLGEGARWLWNLAFSFVPIDPNLVASSNFASR